MRRHTGKAVKREASARRLLGVLWMSALLGLSVPVHGATEQGGVSEGVLRVGVPRLAATDPTAAFQEATLKALGAALPERRLEVARYDEQELTGAVLKRRADLFVVNSALFGYLADAGSGATWLATRKIPQSADPSASVGALFVVRAGEDRFANIEDLRSTRVASADPESFAVMAAYGEVANVTSYPKHFFGKIHAADGADETVRRVLDGRSDAGILRTCELEALVAQGKVSPNALRVVGEKEYPHFACRTSTALYPELVFGAHGEVPHDVRKRVAAALLAVPTEAGCEWTVENNLRAVRSLIRRFGFVPTTSGSKVSGETIDRYKYALLIGFLLLGGAVFYSVAVSGVVARRTKELVNVINEKTEIERTARTDRERLSQLERAGIVSELSSMIAHELKQPVASLITYADGLSLYLSGRGSDPVIDEATREITRQAERVGSIVDRVRHYAKNRADVGRATDLAQIVLRAYETFRSSSDLAGVRVSAELPESAPVRGDPLELELLIVNLLKNGLQALRRLPEGGGTLRVRLLRNETERRWRCDVQDDGPRLSDETFRDLARPVASDKLEGLGLGLSICRVIAERHGARLLFERRDPKGLTATLIIPELDETPETAKETRS